MLADDLRTVLWPNTDDGDEKTWAMRAEIWSDPRAMVGGSDAGAHLDRMCGASYPTAFLADCLRGRQLVPVEQAVHMMTRAAGRALRPPRPRPVGEGYAADVFVFDPARSAPSRPAWSTTSRATPPASSPDRTASCGSWSTGWRRCATGSRPAPSPAPCSARARDTASVVPGPASGSVDASRIEPSPGRPGDADAGPAGELACRYREGRDLTEPTAIDGPGQHDSQAGPAGCARR